MLTNRMKSFATAFCFLLVVAAACEAQVCTPVPTSLVSWWPADGNALDVRSRNNGTLQNGAGFGAGHVGQSFNFTASDQRVEVPDDATLDLTTGITLEAWVSPSQTGEANGGTTFISKSDLTAVNNQPYGLVYSSSGNVLMRVGNGTTIDQTTSTTVLPLSTFTHVAGTYDGTIIRIYVNGVLESSKVTSVGTLLANSLPVRIGANNLSGYLGTIDEMAIYNRALSDAEIQAIFNAGTAGKCKPTATVPPACLVGWWPGEGNANDISGNNNHGTLQNGVGFSTGKVGQAFSLDGVDDFIDVGPAFNLDAYTLETWVFIDSATNTGNRRVISKDNDGLGGTRKLFNLVSSCASGGLSGAPCAGVLIGGASDFVIAPAPLTSGWHHLAGVRDTAAGRLELWVDGVLVASKTPTVLGPIDSNVNTVIGRVGPTDPRESFAGLVDEASIYNCGLTADEIISIFNAGSAGKLKASAPSAAGVEISGRILTGKGFGMSGARVTLTDSAGKMRSVLTNPFGFYLFDDVAAGETYILAVSSKRYVFAESSRVISVSESLSDINFVATPAGRRLSK